MDTDASSGTTKPNKISRKMRKSAGREKKNILLITNCTRTWVNKHHKKTPQKTKHKNKATQIIIWIGVAFLCYNIASRLCPYYVYGYKKRTEPLQYSTNLGAVCAHHSFSVMWWLPCQQHGTSLFSLSGALCEFSLGLAEYECPRVQL